MAAEQIIQSLAPLSHSLSLSLLHQLVKKKTGGEKEKKKAEEMSL